MRKSCEHGRTMIEMLGVLSIIGVLSVGGLYAFGKAMYMYRINSMISATSQAIRDFSLFEKQKVTSYETNTLKMAEKAVESGLMSECKPKLSSIADGYSVCEQKLGEIYPRFFITTTSDSRKYTYMLYVTFLRGVQQACTDFLSRNWSRAVPQKLWKRGKIWIASDLSEDVVYDRTTDFNFSVSSAYDVCSSVCSGASYCSVVFDFTLKK